MTPLPCFWEKSLEKIPQLAIEVSADITLEKAKKNAIALGLPWMASDITKAAF